jgi:hypothetical protein
MNTRYLSLALCSLLPAAGVIAGNDKNEVPVPVSPAPAIGAPAPAEGPDYQQRLYGPGAALIAPEKAQEVIGAFKPAYEKLGRPRVAFYVNRDLVDERSGLRLTGRREKTETSVSERKNSFERTGEADRPANGTAPQTQVNVAVGGGSAGTGVADTVPGKGSSESRQTTVTGENTYSAGSDAAPTLADRLTTREVETLFGRPFRIAGVSLADQKTASALIADKPIDHFTTATNEAARKDREALAKVADVVIEVLVSSRTITVPGVSGDRTMKVPDIQATAIRLSDSAIIGQASASDVLGKDRYAGRIVSQFDAREITEATALALMEDISLAGR